MVPLEPGQLAALAVAVSFAAGLNVYATAATLGLLAQADMVALPAPIGMLEDWWVIAASGALFVLEFFADKVPVFDLIWNALQTFVRVPAGALLAWGATSALPPGAQAIATVAGGAIALIAHGGKLAVRGGVTPSPEPFSNIALSTAEDVVAVGLTWMATQHPYLAAAAALVMLAIVVLLIRWVVRALRRTFRSLGRGGPALPQPSPPSG